MTLCWFSVIDPLLYHLPIPLCPPICLLSEPVQVHRGKLSLPLDPPGSPALSDEEYLSPLEEGMELDDTSWYQRTEASAFKEPPSFQVLGVLSSPPLFRKYFFSFLLWQLMQPNTRLLSYLWWWNESPSENLFILRLWHWTYKVKQNPKWLNQYLYVSLF